METRKRIRPNGPPGVHQSSQHPPRLNILQLPSEVLEAIFAVLTACQVEALRLVCLRFRDIADKNLNLRFLKVLPRVERALKDALKEEKTVTLEKSRGRAVSDEVSHLTRRRRMFGFVRSVVRLLRAICLRYICPMTASSAPFSAVRVFVGGQLLDALDKTLKIAWSRRLRRRNTDVVTLIRVTDLWVTHFHNHHEQKMVVPTLTPSLTASSGYLKSEGILFGSKVIDLLECLEGCQKITSGRFGDGGWFDFHGEYRLRRVFFACLRKEDERPQTDHEQLGLGREGAGSLTDHEQIGLGRECAGSLTDHEQIGLHECLRTLVSLHNENLFVGDLGDAWEDGGLRYGLVTCDKTLYYYGIFGEIGFQRIFGGRVEAEDSVQVTIRVTLRCRGDLCPIDCLKDLTPVQGHSPVPGDPDLSLKLEVECPEAGLRGNRLPTRYECLVESRLDRTAATTRACKSLCPPFVFIDRKRREVL